MNDRKVMEVMGLPAEAHVACPACGEPVWDVAYGYKLAKCWNTAGHEDGGTLAFDTMDED